MPRPTKGGATVVLSSSDDELEVAGMGQVSDQLFEKYLSTLSEFGARDQVFSHGLARVRQYLEGSSADGSACLICLSAIQHREAVWSCGEGCFTLYHLPCIQEWARNQVDQAVLRAMNRLTQFPGAGVEARATAEWGCPKCRRMYPAARIPATYTCFCGQEADPAWDPWRTPHSCGSLCGRPLTTTEGAACTHTCLLLCHPGPCPPCPLVVDAVCYCGERHEKRRCGHHDFSCGGLCDLLLDCGHGCPDVCHPGACPPCQLPGSFPCACGREVAELPCAQRRWQCARVCGQPLPCGKHQCARVCHEGPCGQCPHEGVRTCPCGKVVHPDLACTDKAPSCGGTCGKVLQCGMHRCQDRCHAGECSACRATVSRTCRCGKLERDTACGAELLCERRCANMRACGRHACKRRCCDGHSCPPCEETCQRKLRCGNHKCPAPCHAGVCRPCPLTVSFACACGRLLSTLPCGAESRAQAPRCYATCPVPRGCRHAATGRVPAHRCHFGPCPPCPLPCGTPLPCGHACSSATCHDPAPPCIAGFIPPSAPRVQLLLSDADQLAVAAQSVSNRSLKRSKGKEPGSRGPAAQPVHPAHQAAQQAQQLLHAGDHTLRAPCPPCPEPVQLSCLGGHETVTVACHAAQPYACSQPCGQLLACGNHRCTKPCHIVEGLAACEACRAPCGRPQACGHACPLPCHEGRCPPCSQQVQVPCHCGKASLKLPCTDRQAQLQQAASAAPGTAAAAAATASPAAGGPAPADLLCCQRPCHKQLPHCPHACSAVCHSGPCPGVSACEDEVTVRCECKRQRAKWQCARVQAALQAGRGSGAYDATTVLRLLPCTAECVAAKSTATSSKAGTPATVGMQARAAAVPAAAAGPARQHLLAWMPSWLPAPRLRARSAAALGASEPAQPGVSLQDAGVQDAGGGAGPGNKSSKHLSRAERLALAEQRELQRQRAERVQQARVAGGWLLLVAVGLLLGWMGMEAFAWVDRRMREAWGVDGRA